MAAIPIQSAGYQDLRDYITNDWQYLELYDTDDEAIIRIPTSDNRVVWTNTPGNSRLQINMQFQGSDTDLVGLLPVTIKGGRLFKVSEGGSAMVDVPLNEGVATLNASVDICTILLTLDVPQQA